jgi:hypothetical protein
MKRELENFPYVQTSLHLSFKALTEIFYLNKERNAKEIELVNGPPFEFYRVSLHYMFTMEYIKLMESNNEKYQGNHYASLEKLSAAVYKEKGNIFERQHSDNLEVLNTIRASSFFIKIKVDRDKKFAHTDADISTPLSFSSFSDDEIKEAYDHLSLFKLVMDRCTGMFGYDFVFQHADTQIDNFIKFHTNYKEYYYANYFDAIKKGYH